MSASVDQDDSVVRLRVRSGEQDACVRLTPDEAHLVAGAMLADADQAERFAPPELPTEAGPVVQIGGEALHPDRVTVRVDQVRTSMPPSVARVMVAKLLLAAEMARPDRRDAGT